MLKQLTELARQFHTLSLIEENVIPECFLSGEFLRDNHLSYLKSTNATPSAVQLKWHVVTIIFIIWG